MTKAKVWTITGLLAGTIVLIVVFGWFSSSEKIVYLDLTDGSLVTVSEYGYPWVWQRRQQVSKSLLSDFWPKCGPRPPKGLVKLYWQNYRFFRKTYFYCGGGQYYHRAVNRYELQKHNPKETTDLEILQEIRKIIRYREQ